MNEIWMSLQMVDTLKRTYAAHTGGESAAISSFSGARIFTDCGLEPHEVLVVANYKPDFSVPHSCENTCSRYRMEQL